MQSLPPLYSSIQQRASEQKEGEGHRQRVHPGVQGAPRYRVRRRILKRDSWTLTWTSTDLCHQYKTAGCPCSTSKTKPDTKGRWFIADCVPNPTHRLHSHPEVETFQEAAVVRQRNRKLSEQPANIFLRPDFLFFFGLLSTQFLSPLFSLLMAFDLFSSFGVDAHPFQCPTFAIISPRHLSPDLHHYPKQSGCLCRA